MIIKLLVAEENEDTSSYSGITVFLAFGAGCFVTNIYKNQQLQNKNNITSIIDNVRDLTKDKDKLLKQVDNYFKQNANELLNKCDEYDFDNCGQYLNTCFQKINDFIVKL